MAALACGWRGRKAEASAASSLEGTEIPASARMTKCRWNDGEARDFALLLGTSGRASHSLRASLESESVHPDQYRQPGRDERGPQRQSRGAGAAAARPLRGAD